MTKSSGLARVDGMEYAPLIWTNNPPLDISKAAVGLCHAEN